MRSAQRGKSREAYVGLKVLLVFVAGMASTPAIAYATYKIWVYIHL